MSICVVASGRVAECCCSMLMKARAVAPVAASIDSRPVSKITLSMVPSNFCISRYGCSRRGAVTMVTGRRVEEECQKEKRFGKLCVGRLAA